MLYEIISLFFWPILIYLSYKLSVFALKKYDPKCMDIDK